MTIDLAGFPTAPSVAPGPDMRGFFIPSSSGAGMMGFPSAIARPADPDFANVFVLWLADEGIGATTPIDRSRNAFSMSRLGTEVGSTSIAGPFGGSVWRFPGGAGVRVNNPAFDWATLTNYTHEAWMYADNGASDLTLASITNAKYWASKIGATTYVGDGVTNTIAAAMTFPSTTWQHIAVVKEGASYSLYLQGVRIATSTTAIGIGNLGSLDVGSRGGLNPLTGYVGSYRCTHNVARYSGATYTVPTTQFPTAV